MYRTAYKPWGERIKSQTSGTDSHKYKYTAQEEDRTGLDYYKARFYDSELGQFISADSIVPNPAQSAAYNRYSYVDGNPVNYADPSGHRKTYGGLLAGVYAGLTGDIIGAAAIMFSRTVRNAFVKWTNDRGNAIRHEWRTNDNFRIAVYVVITIAVIVACIIIAVYAPYLLPITVTTAYCMLIGAAVGATIGFFYYGSRKGKWDWEEAWEGAMYGAIIGAVVGYCVGSTYELFAANMSNAGASGEIAYSTSSASGASSSQAGMGAKIGASIGEVTKYTSTTFYTAKVATGAYVLSNFSPIVYSIGTIAVGLAGMYGAYSAGMMTYEALEEHSFTFNPGGCLIFHYDADTNKASSEVDNFILDTF